MIICFIVTQESRFHVVMFLKKTASCPCVKKVRRAPQRRYTPRPNRSKPHIIRPVEDITEDEIELVADNMTDKVYNSATVSSQTSLSILCPSTHSLILI